MVVNKLLHQIKWDRNMLNWNIFISICKSNLICETMIGKTFSDFFLFWWVGMTSLIICRSKTVFYIVYAAMDTICVLEGQKYFFFSIYLVTGSGHHFCEVRRASYYHILIASSESLPAHCITFEAVKEHQEYVLWSRKTRRSLFFRVPYPKSMFPSDRQ